MFSSKGGKFNKICRILDNDETEKDLALAKGSDWYKEDLIWKRWSRFSPGRGGGLKILSVDDLSLYGKNRNKATATILSGEKAYTFLVQNVLGIEMLLSWLT